MFFLSAPQIIVLLGLGIVLTGPDKLPQVAATAARLLKQLQAFSDNARNELRRELGPELDHLNLQDLNPTTFVRNNLHAESQQLRGLRDELTGTPSSLLAPQPYRQHAAVAVRADEPPPFDTDAT